MFCAFAVNFLSAMWFAIRIWQLNHVMIAKCVGFLTIFVGMIIACSHPLIGICVIASSALIYPAQLGYKNWHRHKMRNHDVQLLVDSIILEMRAGFSFRTALSRIATKTQNESVGALLKNWLSVPQTSVHSGVEVMWRQKVAQELAAIDRQSHQALLMMQQWRQRLKLESDFRRRFGQVVMQVRLQAVVITVLYIAILSFSLSRGSWNHDSTLILVSLTLFIMGLGLIFRLGRSVKWSF